jgi:uncharacterized protein
MHINLEAPIKYAIESYSEIEIKIDSDIYSHSLVVSHNEIIPNWHITTIDELNESHLSILLRHKPDVIIIGHKQLGKFAPKTIRQWLSTQRIGLESMSIGAASRTYNVLLSEQRNVVLGVIFASH